MKQEEVRKGNKEGVNKRGRAEGVEGINRIKKVDQVREDSIS